MTVISNDIDAVHTSFGILDPRIDVDPLNCGTSAGAKGDINLGKPGEPVVVTKENALSVLHSCAQVIHEQGVTRDIIWVVIPAWLSGMLKRSDLTHCGAEDPLAVFKSGYIGNLESDGSLVEIYVNHTLSVVDDEIVGKQATHVVFGHKDVFGDEGDALNTKLIGRLYAVKG